MSRDLGPPGRERPGATPSDRVFPEVNRPAKPRNSAPKPNLADRHLASSQQVSWWDVHEHVAPFLEAAGSWPMAGTPEWCALDDSDPVKLAAIYDAARHWALRLETCQVAQCEASHEISSAADWAAIANETSLRRDVYIPRVVA